ncbi:MAG TPA: MbnP family protein [Brumimicrobium sp.]|nr:MbnP family protein [Brumimicrobium sp.]
MKTTPSTNLKTNCALLIMSGLLMASGLLFSCKKDNPAPNPNPNPPTTTVDSYLRFKHKVDNQAVEYDTVKYVNAFGNDFSIETIRYFVSNIAFVKSNGEVVNISDAIYIDARLDGYDQKNLTTPIPNGDYTEMRFTFGLDSVMNQTGAFNNFPEAAMEWPMMMGGGYHYMKLEGRYEDQNTYNHFNFHTGPLNNNKNYFHVTLPMTLNVSNGAFDVSLAMEIQNWFKNPNTFDLTTISQGMMGSQVKQELVKNNGIDVFSVE